MIIKNVSYEFVLYKYNSSPLDHFQFKLFPISSILLGGVLGGLLKVFCALAL